MDIKRFDTYRGVGFGVAEFRDLWAIVILYFWSFWVCFLLGFGRFVKIFGGFCGF